MSHLAFLAHWRLGVWVFVEGRGICISWDVFLNSIIRLEKSRNHYCWVRAGDQFHETKDDEVNNYENSHAVTHIRKAAARGESAVAMVVILAAKGACQCLGDQLYMRVSWVPAATGHGRWFCKAADKGWKCNGHIVTRRLQVCFLGWKQDFCHVSYHHTEPRTYEVCIGACPLPTLGILPPSSIFPV